MYTRLRILSLLLVIQIQLFSATRGDVKILEATETIRYLSQKIVKDYFYAYTYPQRIDMKKILHEEIDILKESFRTIAIASKDSDTKDILEFLSYNKEQMLEIFSEEKNFENASLMIDYGETLLEGVNSIAKEHLYKFSKEEHILMSSKKIQYLLERTLKCYMTIHSGFDNITTQEVFQESIIAIDKNMLILNSYAYPENLLVERKKLNNAWIKSKVLLEKPKKLFIPILLFSSIAYIENRIDNLALHHSKNQ
jgi:hypothetical protein